MHTHSGQGREWVKCGVCMNGYKEKESLIYHQKKCKPDGQ